MTRGEQYYDLGKKLLQMGALLSPQIAGTATLVVGVSDAFRTIILPEIAAARVRGELTQEQETEMFQAAEDFWQQVKDGTLYEHPRWTNRAEIPGDPPRPETDTSGFEPNDQADEEPQQSP